MAQPFLFLRKRKGSPMPGVWTIVFEDAAGIKKQKATKFRGPEQEAKAKAVLKLFIERRERGARVAGEANADGPMTVSRWAVLWLESRAAKGITTVGDYRSRLDHHALPLIGWMKLDAVRPEHIAEVMAAVGKKDLAPRTKRHVYDAMRAMFKKAIPRYIEVNPCSLDTEDLPRRKDADPEWRPNAIFAKAEVQQILTDDRILPDRRAFYAVMFLAGMRFGEIAALRVRHYLPDMLPLGQLQVGLSFNSNLGLTKETKTERPRQVPVHGWLKRILGRWLAIGWADMMGREPGPDDLLLPPGAARTERSAQAGRRSRRTSRSSSSGGAASTTPGTRSSRTRSRTGRSRAFLPSGHSREGRRHHGQLLADALGIPAPKS